MKQQFFFVLLVLVSLLSMATAQFLCGNLPFVADNKTRNCNMRESSDKTKCNKIMLIVTGITSGASGTGASIASGMKANAGVECHITIRKAEATLICRERKGERYTLNLGSTKDVESVMIAITKRMVKITVNKFSLAPASSKKSSTLRARGKIPYVIDAVFPIREDSGFCGSKKIYFKANGSILRQSRSGSRYRMTVYKAFF